MANISNEEVANRVEALFKWQFKARDKFCIEWEAKVDGVYVIWNRKTDTGAYTIDGDLQLIHDWNGLESLMEQIVG